MKRVLVHSWLTAGLAHASCLGVFCLTFGPSSAHASPSSSDTSSSDTSSFEPADVTSANPTRDDAATFEAALDDTTSTHPTADDTTPPEIATETAPNHDAPPEPASPEGAPTDTTPPDSVTATAPLLENTRISEERSPPRTPYDIGVPLRLGVGVVPLVAISARSLMIGGVHTLDDGGFVSLDIAPGFNLTSSLALEFALSAMVPIQGAYGFPEFRLAIMPGFRFDQRWVYARLGAQVMFGDGTQGAVQLSLGGKPWKSVYVGVLGFASTDLIVGIGPELGVRFD